VPKAKTFITRCSGDEWKSKSHWSTECLDVFGNDGSHDHIHGTWTGWHDGQLTVVLSKPWRDHGVGTTLLIHPAARLWRPYTRKMIYRPREHFALLPMELQQWLFEHPEWDADATYFEGPFNHQ
jgi:hypothetical protein